MEIKDNIKIDEVTAKRLAVVRHLYLQGLALSQNGEPTNGLSVLSFHDSVEMFMKICADAKGVRIDRKTNFMDYFEKIPTMKCKAQMDKLNNQRVGLKHHGTIPSTLDVEISRTNVAEFYKLNCPTFFGVALENVSLEVLISYTMVRKYLTNYHEYMNEGEYGEAQAQCQIAFKELLVAYHQQYDRKVDLQNMPAQNAYWLNSPHLEDKTDRYLEKVKEDILNINEAISIMNLGLNYYKYSEFKAQGPRVFKWPEHGEYSVDLYRKSLCSKTTAEACYSFVLDSALKLQHSKLFLY